jgi:FKBP-type peptidyl-prolyl cis-trans isomerase FkpA
MHGGLRITADIRSTGCFIFMVALLLLNSCRDNPTQKASVSPPGKNEMADLNRYMVRKDRERIQNYIERKDLRMTETGSGLWYQVTRHGEGETFSEGDMIIMDYDCSLLDGTECYSSKEKGPRKIVLGRSELEAGLNEGLRLLNPGSEAIFIIPPFLAYGLIGDRKLIPPRAVLVYTVSVRAGE